VKYRFLRTKIERLEAVVFHQDNLRLFRMKDGQSYSLSEHEFDTAWEDYRGNRDSYLSRIVENANLNEFQQRWKALCDAIRNAVDVDT
jgi:hypothetical protein